MSIESENGDRILLSGASGMLGKALRRGLAESGYRITQLVRREPATPAEMRWDPYASPPIAAPIDLEGLTAAIHLSGSSVAGRRWTPEFMEEMVTSRVNSTRALAGVLSSLRQPPKVLLVASGIGYYGDGGDKILDEGFAGADNFGSRLCQQWEAAARPAKDAGIRVVHLRFGMVLCGGEGALAMMAPPFRMGLGGRLGSGRQWTSWIGLADTVAAVRFAIETPALAGPVNVTSPHPVRNAEFTKALARQLRRPALLPVPEFAVRLLFGRMAREFLLLSLRVVPRKLLAAGFQFSQPEIDAALRAALTSLPQPQEQVRPDASASGRTL